MKNFSVIITSEGQTLFEIKNLTFSAITGKGYFNILNSGENLVKVKRLQQPADNQIKFEDGRTAKIFVPHFRFVSSSSFSVVNIAVLEWVTD